ncbi:hypothetical protein CD117_02940 [Mammaliicoccus sciuri]|uniref:Uncharacterized protein n=1 Tax=Mammaliicoccus sciuri TaxID=1296 RepID=A0AAJ4SK52_MAMSC|nr:hypothetical protein [Mammaliicoccus sciuri]RTX74378.1 hypothetical protein CD117_02940 [Mammaliicoccus sciuri]
MIVELGVTILTSSVISAGISSFVSWKMKNKELIVTLKLEEKNTWINNINQAIREYNSSLTDYSSSLMKYSLNEMDKNEIANNLIQCNNSKNSLIYFIFQCEYAVDLRSESIDLINEITNKVNEQRELAVKGNSEKIDYQKLHEGMANFELDIGKLNFKFTEKLGEMVRVEKIIMTNNIIEGKKQNPT